MNALQIIASVEKGRNKTHRLRNNPLVINILRMKIPV